MNINEIGELTEVSGNHADKSLHYTISLLQGENIRLRLELREKERILKETILKYEKLEQDI